MCRRSARSPERSCHPIPCSEESAHLMLRSCANVLSVCVIGCTVLYLDGACFNGWTRWWRPCADVRHAVNFDITLALQQGTAYMRALRHSDVCSRSGTICVSKCARSFMLKLQDLWLGKQITAAFNVPSGRLLASRFYDNTGEVMLKLALILQLAHLCGAALPLMTPLLWMNTLSETALAAASFCQSRSWQAKGSCDGGGFTTMSMAMMACCSTLLHVAFACNRPSALLLTFVILASFIGGSALRAQKGED